MPLYEYRCPKCEARTEVFSRSVNAPVESPVCTEKGCDTEMLRTVSAFARHLTMKDKIVEAEAKFGKEVDDAMGPESDFAVQARRYDRLSKDLPPPDVP